MKKISILLSFILIVLPLNAYSNNNLAEENMPVEATSGTILKDIIASDNSSIGVNKSQVQQVKNDTKNTDISLQEPSVIDKNTDVGIVKYAKAALTVSQNIDLTTEEGKVETFVNHVSKEVVDIINSVALSNVEKEEKLKVIFRIHLDTNWMGRFVMGRYYRATEKSQKKRYLKYYREYLVLSYVPRFREYSGGRFEVLRVRKDGKKDFYVQTNISSTNGDPDIRVDYKVRKNKKGDYKIIDVVGEGISLIATHRSDFGGLISRKGVPYFINKLESKVKSLLAAG